MAEKTAQERKQPDNQDSLKIWVSFSTLVLAAIAFQISWVVMSKWFTLKQSCHQRGPRVKNNYDNYPELHPPNNHHNTES